MYEKPLEEIQEDLKDIILRPSPSWEQKSKKSILFLGNTGENNDALSHHWNFGWSVIGAVLQSLCSCPIYFDPRVRNRRYGRRMESNCPHRIGDCRAGSDRLSFRSCWQRVRCTRTVPASPPWSRV